MLKTSLTKKAITTASLFLAIAACLAAHPAHAQATASDSSGGQLEGSLIGVVMPTDTRPGDTVSATVVPDPQNYAGVPGVHVVQATVPLPKAADGTVSLSGLVVDTGDNKRQSAEKNLLMQVKQNAQQILMRFLTPGSDTPVAQQAVDLAQTPLSAATESSATAALTPTSAVTPASATLTPVSALTSTPVTSTPAAITPESYTTPPVYNNGALQVIHGPLSGNSTATQVLVDNQPGKVIAESPRSVYWKLPESTTPGAHTVILQDSGKTLSSFHVAVVGLKLSADQVHLLRGQSTTMHATVIGADSIPSSAWHAGADTDLVDPKEVAGIVPASNLTPEKPGLIALEVQNKSTDTIKLINAKGNTVTQLLGKESFAGGSYTFNGKLKSIKDGSFNINVRLIPMLAPIKGEAAIR